MKSMDDDRMVVCAASSFIFLEGSAIGGREMEEHVDKAVSDHAHCKEGAERVEDAAEGLEREEIGNSVGDTSGSEEGDEDGDGGRIAESSLHDDDGKDEGDVVLEVVHVDSLGTENLLRNSLGVGELRHSRLVELGILRRGGESVSLAGVSGVEGSKEHLQSEDGVADDEDDTVARDGGESHLVFLTRKGESDDNDDGLGEEEGREKNERKMKEARKEEGTVPRNFHLSFSFLLCSVGNQQTTANIRQVHFRRDKQQQKQQRQEKRKKKNGRHFRDGDRAFL